MPSADRKEADASRSFARLGLLGVCFVGACGASATRTGTGGTGAESGTGGITNNAGASGSGGLAGAGGMGRGAGGMGRGGGDAGRGGIAPEGSGGSGSGAGGSGSNIPIYDPPNLPPLPDGPCKFSSAPVTSLCAGRVGCPAVVDGQFAGDATTGSLDLAATAGGGAHVVFAGTYPSAASNCLFTVDAIGASTAIANPFGPPPPTSGYSGPTVALATDRNDGPHAFLGANTAFRHYHQSGASWISELLPLPAARVDANTWSVLSWKGNMFVLVGSHPPDPGYYRSFNLHLFSSSDGGGSWQMAQVFDGAGVHELMGASSLSADATGEVVATYDTRLQLSTTALGYAAYLWRAGMTATLSTPSPTWEGEMLRTIGDATSKDSVLKFTDGDGVHLVFPRAGQAPRSLLVPGTAAVPVNGCPVSFASGMPMTCAGHGGDSCTLKGSSLTFTSQPQRTDDGAIWFVFARQDIDQDVALRDWTSGGSDALTYCFADIKADRTSWNVYVARAASTDAAGVELRLKLPVAPSGAPSVLYTEARVKARGNKLVLAFRFGSNSSPYRYLVLDASRL